MEFHKAELFRWHICAFYYSKVAMLNSYIESLLWGELCIVIPIFRVTQKKKKKKKTYTGIMTLDD